MWKCETVVHELLLLCKPYLVTLRLTRIVPSGICVIDPSIINHLAGRYVFGLDGWISRLFRLEEIGALKDLHLELISGYENSKMLSDSCEDRYVTSTLICSHK